MGKSCVRTVFWCGFIFLLVFFRIGWYAVVSSNCMWLPIFFNLLIDHITQTHTLEVSIDFWTKDECWLVTGYIPILQCITQLIAFDVFDSTPIFLSICYGILWLTFSLLDMQMISFLLFETVQGPNRPICGQTCQKMFIRINEWNSKMLFCWEISSQRSPEKLIHIAT